MSSQSPASSYFASASPMSYASASPMSYPSVSPAASFMSEEEGYNSDSVDSTERVKASVDNEVDPVQGSDEMLFIKLL